mmetsp:Transcript_92697/g.290142  ORF Transcript_92697/g.290142 Transcript_92697/m.290142 type:complete len:203 (+) Transcript_92697:364-972(+)
MGLARRTMAAAPTGWSLSSRRCLCRPGPTSWSAAIRHGSRRTWAAAPAPSTPSSRETSPAGTATTRWSSSAPAPRSTRSEVPTSMGPARRGSTRAPGPTGIRREAGQLAARTARRRPTRRRRATARIRSVCGLRGAAAATAARRSTTPSPTARALQLGTWSRAATSKHAAPRLPRSARRPASGVASRVWIRLRGARMKGPTV